MGQAEATAKIRAQNPIIKDVWETQVAKDTSAKPGDDISKASVPCVDYEVPKIVKRSTPMVSTISHMHAKAWSGTTSYGDKTRYYETKSDIKLDYQTNDDTVYNAIAQELSR